VQATLFSHRIPPGVRLLYSDWGVKRFSSPCIFMETGTSQYDGAAEMKILTSVPLPPFLSLKYVAGLQAPVRLLSSALVID